MRLPRRLAREERPNTLAVCHAPEARCLRGVFVLPIAHEQRFEARQWESRDAVTIRDLLLCLRRARVDQLLIVDCRRQQPIDVLSRSELHRLAVSPDGEVGRIEDVLGSGRVSANPDLAVQALANE